jgi:hypothetical protein
MVTDTNLDDAARRNCSKCGESKPLDRIVKNRNVCKDCCNARKKEKYNALEINDETTKTCNTCNLIKALSSFVKGRNTCCDCNNSKRKDKYKSDETHRATVIKQATEFKQKKILERRQSKLEELGEGNKKCTVCSEIKPENKFRHNRLHCKNCERDDPKEKFKRNVRSRIHMALKQNKDMHTIKYLGCTSPEYLKWILKYDERYTLENHGKVWHIDHVIPLSRFNLENKEEQLVAFNWRNTMPLLAKENLTKNKKILPSQVEQHYAFLSEYHKNKNMTMPQCFIDLFAKHLVAGIPLEPSLPLQNGNILEEHG